MNTAPEDRPSLSPDKIEAVIDSEHYHRIPGTTTTICALTLRNGFVVIGKSACIHPDNFNAATGRSVAREDAVRQIWQLEGYLLKQQLWEQDLLLEACACCEMTDEEFNNLMNEMVHTAVDMDLVGFPELDEDEDHDGGGTETGEDEEPDLWDCLRQLANENPHIKISVSMVPVDA